MEDNNYAPVIMFVYCRADHTEKVISSLQKNEESRETELYIYSDGYKEEKDRKDVERVRELIHNVSGFRKVTIIEREKNYGLANNIIDGVSEIVNRYGRCIVLEDDIVVSPYFLKYMNEGLDLYENEKKVMAISGFCEIEDRKRRKLPETFFMPWFDCWGWATWAGSWACFKKNPDELVNTITDTQKKRIDINGTAKRWNQVEANREGRICTWAIFFFIQIILANGLVLYPKRDMCKNIGNDGTGVDSGNTNIYSRNYLSDTCITLERIKIESDKRAEKYLEGFYKKMPIRSFYEKVIRKSRKLTSWISDKG